MSIYHALRKFGSSTSITPWLPPTWICVYTYNLYWTITQITTMYSKPSTHRLCKHGFNLSSCLAAVTHKSTQNAVQWQNPSPISPFITTAMPTQPQTYAKQAGPKCCWCCCWSLHKLAPRMFSARQGNEFATPWSHKQFHLIFCNILDCVLKP